MKKIDKLKIQEAVSDILVSLGEDLSREGVSETPLRVARMYEEIFEGMQYSNHEIAEKNKKCFNNEQSDIVIIKNIPSFSYCEHHLALMYDMKISVGYIPDGKVIGLSKIPRIIEMVCKRLQIQERIGKDIFEILNEILNTEDIIVKVEGEHACVRARGVKAGNSTTVTFYSGGIFKNDNSSREEFFRLCES